MAIFGTNRSDATKAFQEICDGLEKLAVDDISKGRGERPLSFDKGKRAEQYGVNRSPWVMTTTEWLTPASGPPKAMLWSANPSDVTWTMAQRSMHTKNLYGTVLHVWPNSQRETFYDEFRLHMNFQSGSIMPIFLPDFEFNPENGKGDALANAVITGRYEPSDGLANFYDFMNIVDAPKLTTRTDTQPARANLVTIQYNSNIFPQLTLTGMFDSNGITFTDSSQEPNQVTGWSADFIVYDTMPRLASNANAGQLTNLSLMQLWKQLKIDKAALPGKSKPASDAAKIDKASDSRNFPGGSNDPFNTA